MATARTETMHLTEMKHRLAEHKKTEDAPEERIAIGRLGGLNLRLARGSGTICIRTRVAGQPTPKLVTVGSFTAQTTADDLQALVDKASSLKRRATNGDDVSLDRVRSKMAAAESGTAPTVQEVAQAFIARNTPRWSRSYISSAQNAMKKLEAHALAKIKAKDAKPVHVAAFVREMGPAGERGAWVVERARELVEGGMREAMATDRVPMSAINPASRAVVELHLKAGTLASEYANHRRPWGPTLPTMLTKITGRCKSRTKWLIVLVAHTGVRVSAARLARVGEFDLNAGVWNIPEAREGLKGYCRPGSPAERKGVAMRVPLSPEVVEFMGPLVKGRPADALVWPGRKISEPITHSNVHAIVRRWIGDGVDLHGLRSDLRMFKPIPKPEWALMELLIGHEVRSEVGTTYDRDDKLIERREYLLEWSRYLTSKRAAEPQTDSNIIEFRRAG